MYFESVNVTLGTGIFYSTNHPLTIHYPGTAAEWNAIIAPKTEERDRSYSNGANGSAPGAYRTEYQVYPLGHKNGDAFVCKVFCHGDGAELICKGSKESVYVCSHSPYDL